MIRIKSNKKPSPINPTILGIGDHIVKIESVEPCFQTENVPVSWTDRTPQIAIKYAVGLRSITQWISLRGYEELIDSSREVDCEYSTHPISGTVYKLKDGKRVEDKDKSNTAMLILAHVAYCSGIPNNSEIELQDLIGRELLIRVGHHAGQLKVIKTFKRK